MDGLAQPVQVSHVADQVFRRGCFCGRPDDITTLNVFIFRCCFFNQSFQARPLGVVLNPLRNTDVADAGHEHKIPGRD